MAVIYFAMVLIVIRFFTPAIIFGEGLCSFLCSYLLSNIMGLLEEKSSRKIFRQLHGREKLQYIWDYYKFPIFAVCILLYIAGYMIYGHFTHKDVLLSTAFVNVSPGNTLAEKLGSGFLYYIGGNDAKEEVRISPPVLKKT